MKATEGQVKFLTACGINEGEARELPRKLATRMCAKLAERRKAGKATLGQLKYLKFAGECVSPNITFGEASKLISIIKKREHEAL